MRKTEIANEVLFPQIGKLLDEGLSVVITVKGDSMVPFIKGERDQVTLRKKVRPGVGDIVLAECSPARFVLHRIVRIDGQRVTLMGDGNLKGCEQCDLNGILGVVTSITRNGRPIDPARKIERAKVKLWHVLLPVRKYLLAIIIRI